MAQFVLDASDLSTEDTFLKYKEGQRRVRARAAQVWQANHAALEEWALFENSLDAGGEVENLAAYNAAYAGQLAGMEAQLQASIANTQAIIQAMQAAVAVATGSELFPGVPLPAPPAEGVEA
jgi:hypothetical protein